MDEPLPDLISSENIRTAVTITPRSERAEAISPTTPDLLDILDGHLVGRPVVELGRARALMRGDRLGALERTAIEQIRRDTRGPEGVAIGRRSGRGPLGGQFDRHAIQADAEITRV